MKKMPVCSVPIPSGVTRQGRAAQHKKTTKNLSDFRKQYVNLLTPLESIVRELGQQTMSGNPLRPDYHFRFENSLLVIDLRCKKPITPNDHFSVKIKDTENSSVTVFADHRSCTFIHYSGETERSKQVTVDDIIFRPGIWIDYIRGSLAPKAEAAAKARREKEKAAAQLLQEQQRVQNPNHGAIDDSHLFGEYALAPNTPKMVLRRIYNAKQFLLGDQHAQDVAGAVLKQLVRSAELSIPTKFDGFDAEKVTALILRELGDEWDVKITLPKQSGKTPTGATFSFDKRKKK